MRGTLVLLTALLLGGCTADSSRPGPGADGAGDSYYPQDGNGGYDVANYRLSIDYDPPTRLLTGDQLIFAEATANLSSFNVDLSGLTVDSVAVDGRPAQFTRTGRHELVITPERTLTRGGRFATEIRYHGIPQAVDGNGWQYAADGGSFVMGEPQGAATWYPVNDTPRDKATFELTVHVPDGWSAVSTGRNVYADTWDSGAPTAPYLTTVAIDRWDIRRGQLADGTPVVNAFAPGVPQSAKDAAARLPEILEFLESKFGPYPVGAAGGIFLTEPVPASLETLGRPTYSGRAGDVQTIVHENAHQCTGIRSPCGAGRTSASTSASPRTRSGSGRRRRRGRTSTTGSGKRWRPRRSACGRHGCTTWVPVRSSPASTGRARWPCTPCGGASATRRSTR